MIHPFVLVLTFAAFSAVAPIVAGPLPTLAPAHAVNAIDQGDPICWEGGWDMGAHVSYVSGKVAQAADFAAGRL